MGNEHLVPLRDLNPSVSPHVAAAIERALAIIPQDRFPSADEFAQALDRPVDLAASAATVVGGGLATLVPPSRSGPRGSRRRFLVGGAALAAVFGGLALAFGFGSLAAIRDDRNADGDASPTRRRPRPSPCPR